MTQPLVQRPCVLVLDDEAAVLEAFARSVPAEDFELVLVRTPGEAFRELETRPVKALVCDYLLGTLNGEIVLTEVRKNHPAVYRLMLSAAPPRDIHTLMDSGVVQRLITKPWDVPSLRATLREVTGLPARKTPSGSRPAVSSGSFPAVGTEGVVPESVLLISRDSSTHLVAGATARRLGMTLKVMENVGLALSELRDRSHAALVLDEEVPLASLVLATYHQLKVAPRLILLRHPERQDEQVQLPRVLDKPLTEEALAPVLMPPRQSASGRVPSTKTVGLTNKPLAHMLAEIEERMQRAEALARSARAELERGAAGSPGKGLVDATQAVSLAPRREDFQELRRQLLGLVNSTRARESFARGRALEARGETEAALQELELAVERDPRVEHLVTAGQLRLKLGKDLTRARQLAQLALSLERDNLPARTLLAEVSRSMGLPLSAARLEKVS